MIALCLVLQNKVQIRDRRVYRAYVTFLDFEIPSSRLLAATLHSVVVHASGREEISVKDLATTLETVMLVLISLLVDTRSDVS